MRNLRVITFLFLLLVPIGIASFAQDRPEDNRRSEVADSIKARRTPPERMRGGNRMGRPGGGRSSGKKIGAVSATGVGLESGEKVLKDVKLTSSGDDENAVQVKGGSMMLTNCTISKMSGNTTDNEGSSFYGTNSAVCVLKGGTVTMNGGTIETDARGANSIMAYGGTVNVSDVTIHNRQPMSRGIHAAGGGVIKAKNLNIITDSPTSSVIATDRGGGMVTVDGGNYKAMGSHSAVSYSTGEIVLNHITGYSAQGEIGVIEGDNSIEINDCDITAGSPSHALMILQSGSGDAQGYNGRITINGGKMTASDTAPLCEIPTRMTGTLTLKDVELHVPSKVLMFVDYNTRWKTYGGVGYLILSTDKKWTYDGDVDADKYGEVNVKVEKGVTWNGACDQDDSAKQTTVEVSGTWNLTANSYVDKLTILPGGKVNKNGFKLTEGTSN